MVGGFLYQHPGQVALGDQHYHGFGKVIDLLRGALLEIIAVALALFAVAFRKGSQAVFSDAVSVPEVMSKVHPLLGSVASDRTVKALADAGEGLLQQGD